MSKYLNYTCFIIVTAVLSSFSFPVETATGGDLRIEVTGLRNDKGFVLLSLFNNGDGFPSKTEKACWKYQEKIKNGKAYFTCNALAAGTYAIAVLHDENANLKMDLRFYGYPKEGYGFSENPRLWFGPPSFKSASFQHVSEQLVSITIRY